MSDTFKIIIKKDEMYQERGKMAKPSRPHESKKYIRKVKHKNKQDYCEE